MRAPIFSRGSPTGDVISGQKAPLGLHNFRLRMCTHKGTPKGSRDLRSLPIAMVLVLLYYILYYYYSKTKTREKAGHAQNILPWLPVRAASGDAHFRSKGPTRADIAHLPVAHVQIILPGTWLTSLPVIIHRTIHPKWLFVRTHILLNFDQWFLDCWHTNGIQKKLCTTMRLRSFYTWHIRIGFHGRPIHITKCLFYIELF
jgi:hypothetical protein